MNYKCYYCNGVSTEKEWNDETKEEFGTETIKIDSFSKIAYWFKCPKCHKTNNGEFIKPNFKDVKLL
jgi:hypothetical protein